ncbi:cysteine hydrolase family protein [Cucumibacter marinus]|uniref:cysteine hydrolase family protein n=1 Tax=Cucumibacter marinus TaxID=1121252 RepID=UPI00040A2ADF|nr:cysteine hydrolase family protein [Cucumibacter marinus]
MSDTALLVIDVQKSFLKAPYWRDDDLPGFAERVNALIAGACAGGMPVIQIFHNQVDGGPFDPASGLVATLDGIDITPDALINKTRHSAFVGTPLELELRQRGITKLIICGIRTEQCCETTARNGSDLGYAVDYVTEATLTFPMTLPNGETASPETIKAHTEMVLKGRFARIATVEQALGLAEASAA